MIASAIGPYRVIEKIGEGGMGEVYLAEDVRLGRKVALKTIASRGGSDAADRLLHEARAAAILNHGNIAGIYDVIEDGPEIYIVMEFVEGATLAARLRYGPMVPDEAMEIAAQILEALDHAHAHGVVHRDLKPTNISITPARKVKILDFGIAKLHPSVVRNTLVDTTEVGRVFGTPGYSAPEQLLGRVGDQRSDLYAVGVLLFEMMAGRPPFAGTDLLGAAMASLGDPPSLSEAAPNVPQSIGAFVARAMAPDPERRFQSASEMLAALRAMTPAISDHPTHDGVEPPRLRLRKTRARLRDVAVAASTAALIVFAGLPLASYWRKAPRAGEAIRRPTVAVLPLDNLSGTPANDYLGAGIAETISTTLARQPDVLVISRSEINQVTVSRRSAADVAKELDVTFIVRGGLQESEGVLQVTLQLVHPDGSVAWGGTYQGTRANLFGLHERAAGGIASAMQIRASELLRPQHVVNPDALADYWQGRALLDRRNVEGNVERALGLFQQAVARDPQFAIGHAALGEAHWAQYIATNDVAWTDRAMAAGRKAVSLDPGQPEVRISYATILRGTGRLEEAAAELQRVLDQQPQHAGAHKLLAGVLADRGDVEGAIAELRRAIEARPRYWGHYSDLGVILHDASRYREAADAFKEVVRLQPESAWGFGNLGVEYQMLGDTKRALENYERAMELGPAPNFVSNLGSLYYTQGRYDEAARAFERAAQMRPKSAMIQRNLGDVYQRLGRRDAARTAYERAVDLTSADLRVNPKDPQNLSRLAVYEAKLGRARDAERDIAAAEAQRPDLASIQFRKAVVYALLNRPDAAIAAAKTAVARGYPVAQLREEDDLRSLRNDPRFVEIIQGNPH